ncbi:MAG: hypothetical protein ACRD04_02840 [Terriglobales bacterium]
MRLRFLLLGFLLALSSAALPAQIVASGAVGAHVHAQAPDTLGTVQAQLGVALPPLPHVLLLWNLAQFGYDPFPASHGVSLATGLEVWLSPSLRPAQSWGPLLLGDVAIGRRWGLGLHGFTDLGVGAGWSLGNWVPYLEFRRRSSFHAGRPVDRQVLVGVKFVLFG